MANTNYPSAENSQTTTRVEKKTNNTTKNIIIGVLAVALLGTWAAAPLPRQLLCHGFTRITPITQTAHIRVHPRGSVADEAA